MLTLEERLYFLNNRIVVRHAELGRFVTVLSEAADRFDSRGRKLKITTIILGAFSASQGIALAVFGKSNVITSIVFAAVGVAVAAIAGIETAFKFETRASELRLLAARCQGARFQHNSEWASRIATAEVKKAIDYAPHLLAVQDETLTEVHSEAAKLGLNIVPPSIATDDADIGHYLLFGDDRLVYGDKLADDDLPPPRSKSRGVREQGDL